LKINKTFLKWSRKKIEIKKIKTKIETPKLKRIKIYFFLEEKRK